MGETSCFGYGLCMFLFAISYALGYPLNPDATGTDIYLLGRGYAEEFDDPDSDIQDHTRSAAEKECMESD